MFLKKKKSQSSLRINSNSAANRHRRMKKNNRQKVLWRQRTFTIREFETLGGVLPPL